MTTSSPMSSYRRARMFCLLSLAVGLTACSMGAFQEDIDLVDRITHRIETDTTSPKRVSVSSEKGNVRLNGEVGSDEHRQELEELVRKTEGVRSLDSALTINPQLLNVKGTREHEKRVQHGQIEQTVRRIQQALSSRKDMPKHSVTISAADGTILLEGTVESTAAAKSVEEVALAEAGPFPVGNYLTVVKVPDAEIRAAVQRILALSPSRSTDQLSFEVQDGVVSIVGNVASHDDIDAILSQIVMTDGVKEAKSKVLSNN